MPKRETQNRRAFRRAFYGKNAQSRSSSVRFDTALVKERVQRHSSRLFHMLARNAPSSRPVSLAVVLDDGMLHSPSPDLSLLEVPSRGSTPSTTEA